MNKIIFFILIHYFQTEVKNILFLIYTLAHLKRHKILQKINECQIIIKPFIVYFQIYLL